MKNAFIVFVLLLFVFLVFGCHNSSYQEKNLVSVNFTADYFIIEVGYKVSVYEYIIFSYNEKGHIMPLGRYVSKQECNCNTRGDCCHECYSPDASNESCAACLDECNNKLPTPVIPSQELQKINKNNITVFAEYDKVNNRLYNIISPEVTEVCLSIFNNSDCAFPKGNSTKVIESYAERGLEGCFDVPDEWTTTKTVCFVLLAKQEMNLTICDNINESVPLIGDLLVESNIHKQDCKAQVLFLMAKDKKDVDICYSIPASGHYEGGLTQSECIIEVAKELKKPSICKTAAFRDDYGRYDCYYALALRLNNAKYCKYIPLEGAEGKRSMCYTKVATATKDEELCYNLDNNSQRNSCLAMLHDEELCYAYHYNYYNSKRESCLEMVDNAKKVDFFCDADDVYCMWFFRVTMEETDFIE